MTLFMGTGEFVWFIGDVVNNGDPLGMGRVQVRIHAHHDIAIPDEALPFAYLIHSVDNPNIGGTGSKVTLPTGTRVTGYFLDGSTRQNPVINGVLSGLKESTLINPLPPRATPAVPAANPLVSQTINTETECVSDTPVTTTTANDIPIDYRGAKFTNSSFVYPVTGYISDIFGSRNGRHHGVDIASMDIQTDKGAAHLGGRYRGPVGQPVYAIADGVVLMTFRHSQGQAQAPTTYDKNRLGTRSFGNCIVLKHEVDGQVLLSVYAHLGTNQDAGLDSDSSGMLVTSGKVSKGQQIGTMGRTHNLDSPTHLHFEIHTGGALTHASAIPAWVIFPKMRDRSMSQLTWCNSTMDYKKTPPWEQNTLPIQSLEPSS